MELRVESNCTLCHSPVLKSVAREGDDVFCCVGCQAVYHVLAQRSQLEGYQQNPLFQQAVRAGLISNPYLLERLRLAEIASVGEPLQKLHLEIADLWCPSCAEVIRLMLLQQRGIRNCVVDYFTDLASVEFSPISQSKDQIFALIQSLGYRPVALDSSEARKVSRDLWLRFAVAAFAALNLMMFAYPIYASYFREEGLGYTELFGWLSFAMAVPVILYSAWPLYQRAAASFRVGILGMESLVAIGVSSAFLYSTVELLRGGARVYFDSMSVIVAFVLLGKIIETRAKFSAKDSLMRLSHSLPRRGRKRDADGQEAFIPLKEFRLGDIAVALTGEKIVLDGVIIEGEGAVDESILTGESTPAVKYVGSGITAGTLVLQGRLLYRVTATPDQTMLQQIIDMVEKDLGKRVFSARLTDQIAAWFVPFTLLLSVAAGLYVWLSGGAADGRSLLETSMLRALSVLLISCPCAIGIAVPLAESHLMHGLAQLGAIVRNRRCLAYLGCETVVVFDKTGTVTSGVFSVVSGLEELSASDRSILKGLTAHSTHPMSCAIAQAIEEPAANYGQVEEIAGRGLRGTWENMEYLLGSVALMTSQGIEAPPQPAASSSGSLLSLLYFAKNGRVVGVLSLGDVIRPEARDVLAQLSPIRCVLLSGDGEMAVEKVARACGFSEWYAGQSPMEKRTFVADLVQAGEVVAMLGDGINDTLALAASHVGISVVSATDVSIQVSDLLLTTDRLTLIPQLHQLARKGRRILKQNLFWAFAYNIVGVGLAMFGVLSPLFAAFAMATSSLMVLLNAQRLVKVG